MSATRQTLSFVPQSCSLSRTCSKHYPCKQSLVRSSQRLGKFSLRSSNDSNGFDGLSSALSLLEAQWQDQQSSVSASERNKKNRWEKLVLDNFNSDEDNEQQEQSFRSSTTSQQGMQTVYLLKPPNNSRPSSIILFLGGAVLGSYPHIAYSELLHRISDMTNAAILAVPYEIGINHLDIAKSCEKLFQKAIRYVDQNMYHQPSSAEAAIDSLPKYALGHSLGCKLHVIRMAAIPNSGQELRGIGYISFNNYGLANSISMGRSFANQLNGQPAQQSNNEPMMDVVFSFMEQAAQGIGIDFTPSPADTERIISMKFTPELQRKCRLFQFDDDELDCTNDFVRCCPSSSTGPSLSSLPGTHLTPVYLKFGVDDLPETAQMFAGQVTDFQSASFGNEGQLDTLVQEICDWMDGKPPTTRTPPTSKNEMYERSRRAPRITGSVIDAEID